MAVGLYGINQMRLQAANTKPKVRCQPPGHFAQFVTPVLSLLA